MDGWNTSFLLGWPILGWPILGWPLMVGLTSGVYICMHDPSYPVILEDSGPQQKDRKHTKIIPGSTSLTSYHRVAYPPGN